VSDRDDKEVLIPEVLPPEDGYRRAPPPPQGPEPRGKPMNPILAGIAIDAIDFITWGPAGLLIGFGAMYWILSDYRMPGWKRFLLSLAAGLYCAIPFRGFVPIATMVGAVIHFRK
jgi:hypothetical protein